MANQVQPDHQVVVLNQEHRDNYKALKGDKTKIKDSFMVTFGYTSDRKFRDIIAWRVVPSQEEAAFLIEEIEKYYIPFAANLKANQKPQA